MSKVGIYIGKAKECELAVLLVDRWDMLPDFGSPERGPSMEELNIPVWGGCWQAASRGSSPLLIVVVDELTGLVMLPPSTSLLKDVLLGWLLLTASVVEDTIEFSNTASSLGAYKSPESYNPTYFRILTPNIYLHSPCIHNIHFFFFTFLVNAFL